MHKLSCGAIWGGIENRDEDLETAGIHASLFTRSAAGGRGGDVHYFSVCDGDILTRMAVADVVGHGEQVSEVASWLYDALYARMNDLDTAGILGDLNRKAYAKGTKAMATAVVAGYYRANHELTYASAGHPAIYVRRAGEPDWKPFTVDITEDGPADLPFAVLEEPVFHQVTVPAQPGDRICLYSDGVLEGPSPDGVLFGANKLEDVLNANAASDLHDLKEAVVGALDKHTEGRTDFDDVTLLIAEIRE